MSPKSITVNGKENMKLLIAIATYKRTAKLQRCIDSILASKHKDYQIIIIADNNDIETDVYVSRMGYGFAVDIQPEHKFVIGAWNHAVQKYFIPGRFDGFIGLCDDVELKPDTLSNAVTAMEQNFSDYDGVIGFKQECPGHPEYTFKWFGQTLMGRKFVERYREVEYQICCPFYSHFYQDEEMYKFAHSMGKFHCEEDACLYHYHPAFVKEEMDATHNVIRAGIVSPQAKDTAIYQRRLKRKLIWGLTWASF